MKTANTTDNKINVVIIDDDQPSIQLLREGLSKFKDVNLCGVATSLEDGERLVAETKPDLLFLDMAFPNGNGLKWYEDSNLPANTRVVFYTCYQRYIHDALSLRVFDFLLKPFDASELDVIIKRFRTMRQQGNSGRDQLNNIPMQPSATHGNARLLSITSVINSKVIVNPADIVYFRYLSDRKLWECVFSNLKRIILKRQTTAETILAYGPDFVRTHKQFIVNIRYVGIINGNDCILLPPLDNITEIKISKSYRRDLLDMFYDI